MDTLILIQSFIMAATGAEIAQGIRDFVGPILMMVMGIVAITFLFKREMTQFIIFITIAVVVAIIFYSPDLVQNMGKDLSKSVGGSDW